MKKGAVVAEVWNTVRRPELVGMFQFIPSVCLDGERWFAERGSDTRLRLEATALFKAVTDDEVCLALNIYELLGTTGLFYYLPLLIVENPLPGRQAFFQQHPFYFYDAISSQAYLSLITQLLTQGQSVDATDGNGCFYFTLGPNWPRIQWETGNGSSNSLLFVSQRYLIKNYRRVFSGINPEVRMGLALTKRGFLHVPGVDGYFCFRSAGQEEFTLGIVEEWLEHQGTAWDQWGSSEVVPVATLREHSYKQSYTLGRVLAEFHGELAAVSRENGNYRIFDGVMLMERIAQLIRTVRTQLPSSALPYQTPLLQYLDHLTAKVEKEKDSLWGSAFVIHGDLHLQQVLKTESGWKVLDLEGEPLKTVAQRENYDSPVKDLASMLRSISYRAHTLETGDREERETGWRHGLLDGYNDASASVSETLLPRGATGKMLLCFFQLDRVVYELIYESQYRPDWVKIPVQGLKKLLLDEEERGGFV